MLPIEDMRERLGYRSDQDGVVQKSGRGSGG